MRELTTENGETSASARMVARMADRLWRFGSAERRQAYVARAQKRLEGGRQVGADAAIVIAGEDGGAAR